MQHHAESHAANQMQPVLKAKQSTAADWAMQQVQDSKRCSHVENRTDLVTDSNTAAAAWAAAKTTEPAAIVSNAASSSAAFLPMPRAEFVQHVQAVTAAVTIAAPNANAGGHWACNDQGQAACCDDDVVQPAKRQKLHIMTVPQVSA